MRRTLHRSIGVVMLAVALVIALLNELKALPGAHNEVYLVVSAAVCAGGIWWLGGFDN